MYDLSLLKSFLDYDNYVAYRSFVKKEDFDKEVIPILDGIDLWYKTNNTNPAIEDIANLTFSIGVPEKRHDYTKILFNKLNAVNGAETSRTLLERFKMSRICQDISVAAYDASEGRTGLLEVLSLADKLRNPDEHEILYVTDDLDDILDSQVCVQGLRWRLNCLNKSLGSLRKGDFGFVFARPETGKTTFLASEITKMAEQLKEEDGPVLWFNNEEQGKKVKLRIYQAA